MLPGENIAAQIAGDLAGQILVLDDRLKRIDKQIRDTFRSYPQAKVIEPLPGMGPILSAEFVVAAGDLTSYADAGHLASAAGLVPVPRDSGRRTGNLHRPKRYSRPLRRVFYLSAQTSIISEPFQRGHDRVTPGLRRDPRLCAAIVDGLTFGSNIIETGTGSYRLATTRTAVSGLTPASGALGTSSEALLVIGPALWRSPMGGQRPIWPQLRRGSECGCRLRCASKGDPAGPGRVSTESFDHR